MTILATKGATKDGSVIVSHSDDDELSDQRIIYVSAADHKPGSKRPVYYDPCSFEVATVRYVGTSRGPGYDTSGLAKTEPLGYIDQVEHTYAYFDGNYGIMNELPAYVWRMHEWRQNRAETGKREKDFLQRRTFPRCT